MLRNMPVQHLEQGSRLGGGRDGVQGRRRRHHTYVRSRRPGSLQGEQKIANDIRFAGKADRQPDAERAFEAKNHLGPPETIDAEIPLQPA